jgi:hypothetical protein
MKATLKPHLDAPHAETTGIQVEVVRTTSALSLRFVLNGRVAELAVPAHTPSRRAHELWFHTCFEAFVRPPAGAAYCEFNFSPSTEWAAYRLSGYREGLTPIPDIAPPRVEVRTGETELTLNAEIDLTTLPELATDTSWRVALSAVIEAADGSKSYWALAHPPGQPDFHHPDCFALELPAPERP